MYVGLREPIYDLPTQHVGPDRVSKPCQRPCLESRQKTVERRGGVGARFTPPEAVTNLDPWEDCLQVWGERPTKHRHEAIACMQNTDCCALFMYHRGQRGATAGLMHVCDACRFAALSDGARCVPTARYDWIAHGNAGLAV